MPSLRRGRKRNIIKITGAERAPVTEPFNQVSPIYKGPPKEIVGGTYPVSCKLVRETGRRSGQMRVTRDLKFHIDHMEEKVQEKVNLQFREIQFQKISDTFKDNLTLLNKSSMNRLMLILHLGRVSGAIPWRWDGANRQILLWEGGLLTFWWIQWALITFQTICLGGRQFWMFLGLLQGVPEVLSHRGMFMSSVTIYWYLMAVCYRLVVYLKQEEMRSYINSMLRFNQEYVEKYLLHLEGYEQGGKIVMNLCIPITCCQIGASLASFLIFHKQPWYLTSYLPYKAWYMLIPGALQDVIVVGSDISIYMLMAWVIVAHAITVDFWLQESHNSNTTRLSSEELRKPNTVTETHRALYVLNGSFNNCMAGLPIPIMKLTIFLGLILCGYVMVRSMNHLFIDEFPSILIFPVGIINCVAAGFGFMYMSAHMHDLGVSCVDSWCETSDKGFRRFLMSCSTMKVWVGRFYFITVATLITFFRIIVDQIIYCIVTFP